MTLKEFNSRLTPDTLTAYAFSMTLPNDIPGTQRMQNLQVKGLLGEVKYMLTAQMHFNNKVVEEGLCELPMYRRAINDKFAPQNFTTAEQIGGYFGWKTTPSTNEISMNISNVAPGENIKINVTTDNSKCNHRLQTYKYKIFRRIVQILPDGTKL